MKFPAGSGFCKFPTYRFTCLVPFASPDGDLCFEQLHVTDASVQAWLRKRRSLDCSQMEPTGLQRGIMPFKFWGKSKPRTGSQCIVQGTWCVGLQVVWDATDDLPSGIRSFAKFFHKTGLVNRCTPLPYLDRSPTSSGLNRQQHTTCAVSHRFIILTFGPSRFHRQWCHNIAAQLTGTLIKTHDWP